MTSEIPPTDVSDPEIRVPLDTLLAALSDPAAFPGDVDGVEVIHTHISVVFLAGDRAYKVKKPVAYWELVDYHRFDDRRRFCEEEVRLNRRLAPSIYLGVVPIVSTAAGLRVAELEAPRPDGEVVEHAVVMTRYDEAATLRSVLDRGGMTPEMPAALGQLVARFHAASRLTSEAAPADPGATFLGILEGNFQGTPLEDNALYPADLHAWLQDRLRAAARRIAPRLAARARAGRFVDAHGDLRLDHVVAREDGFAVVDAIEFSTTLRHIDPGADMGFLAMDFSAKGWPHLARLFESAYIDAAEEEPGFRAQLLPVFRAYRAYVRAAVDFHAAQRRELDPALRARKARAGLDYFALACTELWSQPVLLLMRGLSGTGKSHVGRALHRGLKAVGVQSDALRKELLGKPPTWRPTEAERAEVYSAAMSARTYGGMRAAAAEWIGAGIASTVILDATFLRRADRAAVEETAAELGARVVILDLTCPPDVVRERLRARTARGDDASDADVDVYEAQRARDEPLTSDEQARAVRHDTRRPPEDALCAVLRHVAGLPQPEDAA